MSKVLIATFYKFVAIEKFGVMQKRIKSFALDNRIKGTILVGAEGINSTIAGPEEDVRNLLAFLRAMPEFSDLSHKESWADKMPFIRLKVRLKKEIVTLGQGPIDPNKIVGTYVDWDKWNELISDPEVVLVDTRNDYEMQLGTFKGAIDPEIETFRDFPRWVNENLDPKKHKRVATFCTGGIRGEKATAWMLEQGFEEVYHLKDGILKYLENIPEEENLWDGDCFVFDGRVGVGHGLKPGGYTQCPSCRWPVSEEDKKLPSYEESVSCYNCHDNLTEEHKERSRMRWKQIQLAAKRGRQHLGADLETLKEEKRRLKEELMLIDEQEQQTRKAS